MRPRLLIGAVLSAFAFGASAQSESAVRASEGGYGLVRTNISLAYDHTFGKVTDGFNARVSYEFLNKKPITLTGNFKYNSVTCGFDRSDLNVSLSPDAIHLNGTHTMEQIGLTATANARLFGRPLMGLVMVNSEWGKGGFNRVSAAATAMLMLRADRATQLGVGLLGMINTTSKVPVFPVFVYRHAFSRAWRLNLYGAMFGLDYMPSPADMISLGADVDVKSFYFRPSTDRLPRTCRYTQTDFRPMLKYSRRLLPHLYLDFRAGYAVNMKSRVTGVNGTKEYIAITRRPRPFLQASASYAL